MQFDRTGIILYTLKYAECISFYKEVLQLKVLFSTNELTCFDFGGCYLMVEVDDEYDGRKEDYVRTRTCLRMNVKDVKYWADLLTNQGIQNSYQEHSWGTITKFEDPDGNLLAFKDSATFDDQVKHGHHK